MRFEEPPTASHPYRQSVGGAGVRAEKSSVAPDVTAPAIAGAMTVDVEDYFQVAAFANRIRREDWDSFPCRVERNLDRILAIFEERGIAATFFTLGWIAERYPRAIQRIV